MRAPPSMPVCQLTVCRVAEELPGPDRFGVLSHHAHSCHKRSRPQSPAPWKAALRGRDQRVFHTRVGPSADLQCKPILDYTRFTPAGSRRRNSSARILLRESSGQVLVDRARKLLIQSEVLPHSGLWTDSPARQGGEGIVVLRRVTLTPQADSSGAPEGLASRRVWTALSSLDVGRATDFAPPPCHKRRETS